MPPLNPFSRSALALAISSALISPVAQATEITVNSNLDNGTDCTLREAIASANTSVGQSNGCATGSGSGTDTITFSGALASNTITLNGSGLSLVDKNIDIDASAISGGITVDANSGSRVFYVESATLSIDNLTITGGYHDQFYGGGIYANNSNVSLSNSTVSGNTVSLVGGGIYVKSSSLSLSNSTLSGNSARIGGGISTELNSFRTSSSVSLSNSTVSGNSAEMMGGGIYAKRFCNITLSNSTVSGNSAGVVGGGIFANDACSVTLSNSIIANSSSGDDVSVSSESSLTSDSASIIEEASFDGSRTGDPGLLPLADNGGPTLTHALAATSIARNTGVETGAAAGHENCSSTDQRGQLRDSGDGTCDVGALEFGLVTPDLAACPVPGVIEVNSNLDNDTDCTLREAIASANTYVDQDNGCTIGSDSGVNTITFSSSLASNTITLNGPELSLVDKNIDINASAISGGITVDANEITRVFKATSATLSIDNLTITGGYTGFTGGGAGIYADASTITLSNSTILGNRTGEDYHGGGIYAKGSSIISLSSSAVSGNSTARAGGGIYTKSSSLSLSNSTLSGNSAERGGGIAADTSSSVSLSNNTLSGNWAYTAGGGIYAKGSSMTLSNSIVSGNSAGYTSGSLAYGGGIYAIQSSVTLNNSTVSGNSANEGGGIYANNSNTISLSNSTVSGNSADLVGGGINASSKTSVYLDIDSFVTDNSAGTIGGGIRFSSNSNSYLLGEGEVADRVYNNSAGVGSPNIHPEP